MLDFAKARFGPVVSKLVSRETATVDEFEPVSDVGITADSDDTPVESSARNRDSAVQKRRHRILIVFVLVASGIAIWLDYPYGRVFVASLIMYLVFRLGLAAIGAFARPVPAPPPPGELRKVRLIYRCELCGTELRMILANDEAPEAPKHCTESMTLIATADDAL